MALVTALLTFKGFRRNVLGEYLVVIGGRFNIAQSWPTTAKSFCLKRFSVSNSDPREYLSQWCWANIHSSGPVPIMMAMGQISLYYTTRTITIDHTQDTV